MTLCLICNKKSKRECDLCTKCYNVGIEAQND